MIKKGTKVQSDELKHEETKEIPPVKEAKRTHKIKEKDSEKASSSKGEKPTTLLKVPVLTLRDTIVFPHMSVSLFAGRPRSIAAVKKAIRSSPAYLFLLTQKTPTEEILTPEDIYHYGTLCYLEQGLELFNGTLKILVTGKERALATSLFFSGEYIKANIQTFPEELDLSLSERPLKELVLKEFNSFAQNNPRLSRDPIAAVSQIENTSELVDTIVSYLSLSVAEKQKFLETSSVVQRLEMLLAILDAENNVQNMEKRIHGRIKKQIEKNQREYYLNEQLRAIHQELGTGEDEEDSLNNLEERIKKMKFPKEAQERALSKLKKLRAMNSVSPEASVVRNYIEWLVDLPWNKTVKVNTDLTLAEEILDRDHYGLKRIKERVLEYLAVQARVKKSQGQILCFVGPPGVGKTSLGKSIAEATGRPFVKISLGGVNDEAEIRGHRSTYIGAMPGRIIQALKKAKASNPVFLLDEVDKLSHDWRGDPTSALLEVLDPEQNSTFEDHYIELDYDLSHVMFIATANSLEISRPLLDRMEIIRISGYTDKEKMHIAKEHLLPKQLEKHGLSKTELIVPDETIETLIQHYTREAGVRNLERELANFCRKAVREMAKQPNVPIEIDAEKLHHYAGPQKYTLGQSGKFKTPGVATGLAWTEVGGDLLFIEVLVFEGKGNIIQTGNLGNVMKESIQAALSYVRSKSSVYKLEKDFFEKHDIHVHVPEGATPKDGPSAGSAICTALVSALTGTMVRDDVAMTGEVNLRGQVSEIGGLKEKLLAAYRGGIHTVLIPEENKKDLEEIEDEIRSKLEIKLVENVDEVLAFALVPNQ